MATRAWTYFLYDEQLDQNSEHLKVEGIRYIGQTTDPNHRLAVHKNDRPHLAHCRMVLLREHEGPDAILKSMADEVVLFMVKEFFTHLEPNTEAGRNFSSQLNEKAHDLALDIPYGLEVFSDLGKILMKETAIEFPYFKCPKCHKEFTTVHTLNRHTMEIHKRRKFFCPIPNCSTSTTERFALFRHLKRIHHHTEEEARRAINFRKLNKRMRPY